MIIDGYVANEIIKAQCSHCGEFTDYELPKNKMIVNRESFTDDLLNQGYTKGYQKGRADAIADVKSWFDAEFKKQNDPNSKFVPSCVIKENIYDVLEKLKER